MKNVAATVCASIYFELCCHIVGEFFPAHPAERFVLNGKVKVINVDQGVFATECVVERRPSRKDVSGRHHQSRAELGPMPTWVVRMVAELSWGLAGTGRGLAPVRCPRRC